MSKGLKLLSAVLALALLVGGYFAVSHFLGDEETETEETTEAALTVKTFDADDITGIKYVYGDETIELVKESGKWQLKSDSKFPVNQAYPSTMVTATAGLAAKRLVSTSTDMFSQYGLSEPKEAFFFTRADGDVVTVYIGDHNTFSDAYYINIAGTNNVYLVEAAYLENFHYGIAELAEIDDIPTVASGDVTDVKVKTEKSDYELKNYPKGLNTVYTNIYTWFTSGGTPLDATKVSSFISTVTGFKSAGCGDYKATEDELKKYGFSEPTAVVEIAYTTTEDQSTGKLDDEGNDVTKSVTTEHNLKLTVGGYATKGVNYYARFDNSDVVYLIDKSYIESLDNADIESLRPMDVCMIDMDSIESLDVIVAGQTHQIVITRVKDDDGKTTATYKKDGKTITASDYDGFFSAIQAMQAEKTTSSGTTDSAPYITVVYHRNTDTFTTMTLKFIPYDSSFYLVDFDGERRLLVNKLDVEDVMTAFNAIKSY